MLFPAPDSPIRPSTSPRESTFGKGRMSLVRISSNTVHASTRTTLSKNSRNAARAWRIDAGFNPFSRIRNTK